MKNYIPKIKQRVMREWKDKKNIPFKVNRDIHRFLMTHSKNPRPGSFPYVSGDSFRELAQHIFDEISIVHPEKVKSDDIIFVGTHFIEEFFKKIHPLIKAHYKLITHNSDNHITSDLLKYIDDKIIHWYAQNVKVSHPKITPIPYGLENLHFYTNGNTSIIKKEQEREQRERQNKILFGFSVSTNPGERQPALDNLLKTKLAEKISGWPNAWKYLKILNSYKFVAAPPGNGIDSPREWQALYLGVVPVVKRSIMTEYFRSLGLPMWLIDDWGELRDLDAHDLEKKYHDLTKDANTESLYLNYWIKKIKQ